MTFAETLSGRFLPSDPILDRRGRPVPEGMAFVLGLLRIMVAYGHHLSATLNHRATRRTFSVIGLCFGTSRLNFILARVARGLLRAVALERVLMERAARGGDLYYRPAEELAPRKKPAQPPAGQGPPRSRPVPRPDPDAALTLDTLPTVGDLVAEIRRRRWIGRALASICTDLGIAPGVCDANFFTALYQAMRWYRGNFVKYHKETCRRAKAFEDELDRNRDLNIRYDWPDRAREATRAALGFFVGEDPGTPFALPDSPPPPDPPIPRPT